MQPIDEPLPSETEQGDCGDECECVKCHNEAERDDAPFVSPVTESFKVRATLKVGAAIRQPPLEDAECRPLQKLSDESKRMDADFAKITSECPN